MAAKSIGVFVLLFLSLVAKDCSGQGSDTFTYNRGLGDVFAWGLNNFGQLFVGDGVTNATKSRFVPEAVTQLPRSASTGGNILISGIAGGDGHTVILSGDGEVYSVGGNMKGQLGIGDHVTRFTPTIVSKLRTENQFVRAVAAGSFHSLVATDGGSVWAWGDNNEGQLGVKDVIRREEPIEVKALREANVVISNVAAGLRHSVALTNQGKVYTWGANSKGQLGLGDFNRRTAPEQVKGVLETRTVVRIAAGDYHTVALTNTGDAYAWGYNANGQLGTLDTKTASLPQQVRKTQPGTLFLDFIAAGAYHSVVVNDAGDVYTFGSNRDGQLGLGFSDFNPHPAPEVVPTLVKLRGIRVFAGAYHNVAVTVDQRLFVWGWNKYGQLGVGGTQSILQPVQFSLPQSTGGANQFVVHVSLGFAHSLVATETGDLSFCGFNRFGQFVCNPSVETLPPFSTDEATSADSAVSNTGSSNNGTNAGDVCDT